MRSRWLALLLALCAPATVHAAEPIQPGDRIAQGCTLGWVFDGSRGEVYFASAAHCFSSAGEEVYLAGSEPAYLATSGDRLGTVRVLGEELEAATDAALIEVDAAMEARVAPELRGHPTFPSGVADVPGTAGGDLLQLSGWGTGFDVTEPTRQRRQGIFLESTAGGLSWRGATPVSGGDSGGPVGHVDTGTALGLVKGHSCRGGGTSVTCGSHGPTVAGIEAVAAAAGLSIRLRRAGELAPLPAAPETAEPSEPAAPPPPPAAPPASRPSTLPVRAVAWTRSARRASRRRSLAVKLAASQPVTTLSAQLRDRKGRLVGRGKLAAVTGTATMKLALVRKLAKGRYALALEGFSDGRRLSTLHTVALRR